MLSRTRRDSWDHPPNNDNKNSSNSSLQELTEVSSFRDVLYNFIKFLVNTQLVCLCEFSKLKLKTKVCNNYILTSVKHSDRREG